MVFCFSIKSPVEQNIYLLESILWLIFENDEANQTKSILTEFQQASQSKSTFTQSIINSIMYYIENET